MLQTSARLLRLLTMLQVRRSWTGAELAERLEVTDRTLRRDVDRLRSLGYPVHSNSGIAGGYSLGAGAALPPLMLDDDEGVAVAIALETSASSLAGSHDAAQRALAKLEQVLPNRLRRRLKALRASIVQVPRRGPDVELGLLAALAGACSETREVRFKYRDFSGNHSERSVEPQRIVHMERRWYLVAWDKTRADYRTFRLDRMGGPIATGALFTPRAAPADDVGAYVARAVTNAPYKYRARVILHASFEQLCARLPARAGLLEELDAQRCRFQPSANSLDAIAIWLGMLDVEFEIEDPPELIAHLKLAAERLARAVRAPSVRESSRNAAPTSGSRSPQRGRARLRPN